VQADLKAFAACGAHGMTALTAITAQNTIGVTAIHPVPADIIVAQVRAVVEDIGVDGVKVGMVGTVEAIAAVAEALALVPSSVPVVIDPVMVASSGAVLLEAPARIALIERLLPWATVLTPNIPEALALVGDGPEGGAELEDAGELARAVLALGPTHVVLTGGHRDVMTDVYCDGQRVVEITGPRYDGGATHGSGCTHSSALAAWLAWGVDPLEAAHKAKEIAAAAVRDGLLQIGAGAGPVDVLGLSARSPLT
jgi:hydroxymethylpyrimidine/phosphomethylpyrimidine kinase